MLGKCTCTVYRVTWCTCFSKFSSYHWFWNKSACSCYWLRSVSDTYYIVDYSGVGVVGTLIGGFLLLDTKRKEKRSQLSKQKVPICSRNIIHFEIMPYLSLTHYSNRKWVLLYQFWKHVPPLAMPMVHYVCWFVSQRFAEKQG